MKQILQDLRSGRTAAADVPAAGPRPGQVLIRTAASLISPGTERMLIEFGRAGWITRARQQPDRVRQTWHKLARDGWRSTREAIQAKLERPIRLGYAQSGVVAEVGEGVTRFRPGDRVVSNGPHAEWVTVPETLCAAVPDAVDLEQAPGAILGAIALEALRRAQPSLGETFLVAGLGPIGLLAVQLLRAQGCRVLAADLSAERIELARRWGAIPVAPGADWTIAAEAVTAGRGVDGVILALATRSPEPLRQAARCCRSRGRIVLVGTGKLEIPREEFYRRELRFEVSCSYGPGRYDPAYEEEARDYPFGHVRWTAQRNIEAVLELMAQGQLDVGAVITHRFPASGASQAYERLSRKDASVLSILLAYGQIKEPAVSPRHIALPVGPRGKMGSSPGRVRFGLLGAGDHATRTLLPALAAAGADPVIIASKQGVTAAETGRRFGFREATTEAERVLDHPEIEAVIIATPHATHASLVVKALERRLAVFVEKPLADTWAGLRHIEDAYRASGSDPFLLTGYNRRFAPLTGQLTREVASCAGARSFSMTVNAGARAGLGGENRVIGEACHFIDLMRFLAGAPVESMSTIETGGPDPSTLIQLQFANRDVGSIQYLTSGNASAPKERLEVYGGGRILVLDNFRALRRLGGWIPAWPWPGSQDKGHRQMIRAFVEAVAQGKPSPIPAEEQFEVAALALEAAGVVENARARREQEMKPERECA